MIYGFSVVEGFWSRRHIHAVCFSGFFVGLILYFTAITVISAKSVLEEEWWRRWRFCMKKNQAGAVEVPSCIVICYRHPGDFRQIGVGRGVSRVYFLAQFCNIWNSSEIEKFRIWIFGNFWPLNFLPFVEKKKGRNFAKIKSRKMNFSGIYFYVDSLFREAAKKGSFLSGRATKRWGAKMVCH